MSKSKLSPSEEKTYGKIMLGLLSVLISFIVIVFAMLFLEGIKLAIVVIVFFCIMAYSLIKTSKIKTNN